MTAKASFDLPRYDYQSTQGARRAYHRVWSREWPHDDVYLRELARRIETSTGREGGSLCDALLMAMREQHVFEEDRATLQ